MARKKCMLAEMVVKTIAANRDKEIYLQRKTANMLKQELNRRMLKPYQMDSHYKYVTAEGKTRKLLKVDTILENGEVYYEAPIGAQYFLVI